MSSALKQAEEIVDAMNPRERVRLLRYLAPRISEPATAVDSDDSGIAWRAFRKIGRQVARLPRHGVSVTQLVSDMRR